MPVTVRELAELVHGTVHGEADTPITDAHSLAHARPGHITFLESDRHVRQLAACQASAVVVPTNFPVAERTAIRVADPLTAFVAIVERLRGKASHPAAGVDPRAIIDPSAVLGPSCSIQALAHVGANTVLGARCRIYPGVVIGRDCRLGDDVTIFPNAVIYDGIVLGNRVIVHGNAVIGADGFGYRLHQGKHVKVPQLGNVVIGDDVEIGACSSVDRGTFDATTVGPGTKIDNQVQIGHNCTIGPHNLIVSQVGIAGSCTTGAYVVIAGQAGLADHIHLGDQVVLGARSGVTSDLLEPGRYFGAPATPERDQKRMLASLLKLPDMRRDLLRIKKHLGLSDEEPGRSGEPSRTSADGAARLAAPTSDEAAA